MVEPAGVSALEVRARMRWLVVAICLAVSVPTTLVELFGPSAAKSDYITHMEVVDHIQHGRLEVAHFVFHGSVALLGFLLSNAIAAVLVIAIAQVGVGLLLFRIMDEAFAAGPRSAERAARWALVVTAGLVVCGPLNLVTFPKLYLGYVHTTTYHSPTIQVLKPLAVLLFLRLYDDLLVERKVPRTSPGLLSLALLSIATTMAKPSFSIVVLPALAATVLLYHRTVPWRRALATLAVLSVCIGVVIVWQVLILYTGLSAESGSDSGVGVRPFVVALQFAGSPRLLVEKLVLSIAFPLVALGLNARVALADRRLVFSYLCLIVSLAYYLLLAEVGPRLYHGNFLWGAIVSLFLVFVSTSAMLARQAATLRTRASWLIFGLHVACGLVWLAAESGLLGHLCDDGWASWCW